MNLHLRAVLIRAINAAASMIALVAVARSLGPQTFGEMTELLSIATIINGVLLQWISVRIQTSFYSDTKKSETISCALLFFAAILALAPLILLLSLVGIQGNESAIKYLTIILLTILAALGDLSVSVSIALFDRRYLDGYYVVRSTGTILAAIFVMIAAPGALISALILGAVSAANFVICWVKMRSDFGVGFVNPTMPVIRDRVRAFLTIAPGQAASSVLLAGDKVLATYRGGPDVTGIYTAIHSALSQIASVVHSIVYQGQSGKLYRNGTGLAGPDDSIIWEYLKPMFVATAFATLLVFTAVAMRDFIWGNQFAPFVTAIAPWILLSALAYSYKIYVVDVILYSYNRDGVVTLGNIASALILLAGMLIVDVVTPISTAITVAIANCSSLVLVATALAIVRRTSLPSKE